VRTGDEAEIAPTYGVTSRCHADIFRRVFQWNLTGGAVGSHSVADAPVSAVV